MITQHLIVNNIIADLPPGNPIAVTFQVNDLSELTDRQSTYSQAIKLPKTATNRRIFDYADDINFSGTKQYRLNPAKYIVDGVEILPYCYVVLKQVTDYFECQITYGLFGFNDVLSITVTNPTSGLISSKRDAMLTDLDWSDIPTFKFDLATITASQTDGGPNNVLWPVIDYGNTLTNASDINITYLRPGIYLQQIMGRIQNFTGYSFYGGILSDPYYLSDFIPFSATVLYDYEGTKWTDTHLPLSVQRNLPAFSLKDVLKDFMQRYFLTADVDNYKKTITFKSFNELYNNISQARDWTDKFINDAKTDDFILSSNYAQINYLAWAEDQPYLTNGNGIINIDNQQLQLNTTLLTSIFANTDYIQNVLGGKTVATIKKFPESPLPNFGVIPTIDTQPRIVTIRRITGTYSFTDSGGNTKNVDNPYTGFFWDQGSAGIGYDNQLQRFGQGLLKLLNNTRVSTRYLLLNSVDLKEFDFSIPVYDAKSARYYYVNRIENYMPGVKTKVGLIKM
jgi:hypothetical protein